MAEIKERRLAESRAQGSGGNFGPQSVPKDLSRRSAEQILKRPYEKKMDQVLQKLKLQEFDFKLEKDGKENTYDFLGISITQTL